MPGLRQPGCRPEPPASAPRGAPRYSFPSGARVGCEVLVPLVAGESVDLDDHTARGGAGYHGADEQGDLVDQPMAEEPADQSAAAEPRSQNVTIRRA